MSGDESRYDVVVWLHQNVHYSMIYAHIMTQFMNYYIHNLTASIHISFLAKVHVHVMHFFFFFYRRLSLYLFCLILLYIIILISGIWMNFFTYARRCMQTRGCMNKVVWFIWGTYNFFWMVGAHFLRRKSQFWMIFILIVKDSRSVR